MLQSGLLILLSGAVRRLVVFQGLEESVLNGLPERFRFQDDRLFSQTKEPGSDFLLPHDGALQNEGIFVNPIQADIFLPFPFRCQACRLAGKPNLQVKGFSRKTEKLCLKKVFTSKDSFRSKCFARRSSSWMRSSR